MILKETNQEKKLKQFLQNSYHNNTADEYTRLLIKEYQKIASEDAIFQLIYNDFIDTTKQQLSFKDFIHLWYLKFDNLFNSYKDKVRTIQFNFIPNSNYISAFYEILKKYNYNMNSELTDAISSLGLLTNPNQNVKEIQRLLKSPYIQDVSYNGLNEFTIYSEEFGQIPFELASYYFRHNSTMQNYINYEQLTKNCHQHTYWISRYFKHFHSVTSQLPSYFDNLYYHSYSLIPDENLMIDLCSNAIFNKDIYYALFQPKEIINIPNVQIQDELKFSRGKTNLPKELSAMMKIAIYYQHLNNCDTDLNHCSSSTLKH